MTETIYISLDEEIANEIEQRAGSRNLSSSNYIKLVLQESLECGESKNVGQE